jgi:hypothetical protein
MKRNKGLAARYNRSEETKDQGLGGTGAFAWQDLKDKDGDKVEVKFFKPVEGKNRINIIPYRIKTKQHPLVRAGSSGVGDLDYVMDFWQHPAIGSAQENIVCPKKTFGKPCPICDLRAEAKAKGNKEDQDALRPKRRVVYNVIDVNKPERGLQVFDVSHYLFEKELIEEARASGEDGDIVDFADIEVGKVVLFRGSMESIGKGNDYLEFKGFKFIDRDEPLDDSVIDSAVSFDEIMRVHSADEIDKILNGVEDEEAEDEREKKDKRKDDDERPARKAKDDDDEPPKKSKTRDEDDDDVAAKKGAAAAARDDGKTTRKAQDDDEPEDKPKGKCSFGHKFGADCDDSDDCDKCKDWDACAKAQPKKK